MQASACQTCYSTIDNGLNLVKSSNLLGGKGERIDLLFFYFFKNTMEVVASPTGTVPAAAWTVRIGENFLYIYILSWRSLFLVFGKKLAKSCEPFSTELDRNGSDLIN